MNTLHLRWLVALAAVSATIGTSCTSNGVPPTTEQDSPTTKQAAAEQTSADDQAPPDSSFDQREEIWMACFINGGKIGYTHLIMEPSAEDGRPCLRFNYDDELKLRRFGTDTVVRTRLTSLETRDGQLLSFRSDMQAGPRAMTTEGRREDSQLKLRTSN